jgi:N-dimethylarginine dimethylaminohydrolase
MWKVRFIDYNYTASRYGEKLWKKLSKLPAPEFYMELREPCNCFEEHGYPMHSDGGNYHYIIRFYILDNDYMLCVWNTTREAFSPWEQGYVHVSKEKQFVIWTETISDCSAEVMKKEEALKYIEDLIKEGYYVVKE